MKHATRLLGTAAKGAADNQIEKIKEIGPEKRREGLKSLNESQVLAVDADLLTSFPWPATSPSPFTNVRAVSHAQPMISIHEISMMVSYEASHVVNLHNR